MSDLSELPELYVPPDCRCGHPEDWHRHMRGYPEYCGTCDCRAYRRPPGRFRRWCERWLW